MASTSHLENRKWPTTTILKSLIGVKGGKPVNRSDQQGRNKKQVTHIVVEIVRRQYAPEFVDEVMNDAEGVIRHADGHGDVAYDAKRQMRHLNFIIGDNGNDGRDRRGDGKLGDLLSFGQAVTADGEEHEEHGRDPVDGCQEGEGEQHQKAAAPPFRQ
jgi:hypothetical protein